MKDRYTGMLEQNEKMLSALTKIESQTKEESLRREFERKQIEQKKEDRRMLERQKQLADHEEKIERRDTYKRNLYGRKECKLKLNLQRKS